MQLLPRIRQGLVLVSLMVAAAWPPSAGACPYAVRTVGFSGWKRPPFQVYWLVNHATPNRRQVTQAFEQASDMVLFDSNVDARVVNVDEPAGRALPLPIRALNVKRFPSAVLAGPAGRVMVVPHIGGERTGADTIRSALEHVVWSPAREEIAKHVVRHWCVMVVVPGTDRAENARVDRAIAAASKEIVGFTTVLNEVVSQGPHVVPVSGASPKEAVLLWALGLDRADRARTHAVVVYGRGRRAGPTLTGEELTKESLLTAFRALGENCECTTAQQWQNQPPVPLRWDETRQAEVRRVLKVDEEQMQADVLSTWSVGGGTRSGGAAVQGYVEMAVPMGGGDDEGQPSDVAHEASSRRATRHPAPTNGPTRSAPPRAEPSPDASPLEQQTGWALLFATAGLAVLVLAVGLVLVWRMRQRN